MNTKYKIIIGVLVVLVLGAIGYAYVSSQKQVIAGASAVGTTNSTQRIASIVCNNTATTTYASFYNGDQNARLIEGITFSFLASTTSALANIEVGTSTGPAGQTANVVAQTAVATSSQFIYLDVNSVQGQGSSTAYIASNAARQWWAGGYLNFTANATSVAGNTTATSGAACIAIVKYAAE